MEHNLLVKSVLLYVVAGMVVLVTACAKRIDPELLALQNKPDWVSTDIEFNKRSKDSLSFPSHLYIKGHGVGADRETAKANAWDDLIEQLDKELKKSTQSDSGGKNIIIDRYIDRSQLLESRQIADNWIDPVNDVHHVLIIIDRVEAGKKVADQIYILDNQIQRSLDKANAEKDPLQRIAFARLAITKYHKRKNLVQALRLIKPTAVINKSELDVAKIQKHIDSFVSSTKIKPLTEAGEDNSRLLEALASGIEKAGFNVERGIKPDYILKATVERKAITWKDGVFTMHGKIKLELIDGQQKNQIRGSTSWPIEVSALDRESLPDKLADAVKDINSDKLKDAFIQFQLN